MKKLISLSLTIVMILSLVSAIPAFAADTDTTLTNLAVGINAVTFGFDNGGSVKYDGYDVYVKKIHSEAEAAQVEFTADDKVDAANVVTYRDGTGTYRRMFTVKGLDAATIYAVKAVNTAKSKTLTGVVTTAADDSTTANIAIGAAVTASEGEDSINSNYPPHLITTGTSLGAGYGNRDLWITKPAAAGDAAKGITLTVDLGAEKNVSKVELYNGQTQGLTASNTVAKYKLEAAADNLVWKTISEEVTSNTDGTADEIEVHVTYRYFKITVIKGGSSSTRIADFRVYAEKQEPIIEDTIENLNVIAKSDTAVTVAYDYDATLGFTEFDIYLNGNFYESTTSTHNVICISGLNPNTQYTVGMVAHNESGKTNMATTTATTLKSRETTAWVNVALGADVTADAETNKNYPATRLVNGVAGTYGGGSNDQWHAVSAADTAEIVVDLGSETDISKLEIIEPSSYGVSRDYQNADSYTVSVSTDGSQYSPLGVYYHQDNGIITDTLEESVNCRYIKIILSESTVNPSRADGKYEWRLGDIKIYSKGLPFTVQKPVITTGDDTLKATVSYTNYNTEAKLFLILALYNGDTLVTADSIRLTEALSNADLTVELSTKNVTYTSAKAFVWDDLSSITPLAVNDEYKK